MSGLITTIHIVTCLILIIAVLLQSGKSADLAGAFGGVGSQTVFGARGAATLLSKVTTICAVLFMITSMGLWILSAKGAKSVVSGEKTSAKDASAVTETKKETSGDKAPAAEQKKEKEDKSSDTEKKE